MSQPTSDLLLSPSHTLPYPTLPYLYSGRGRDSAATPVYSAPHCLRFPEHSVKEAPQIKVIFIANLSSVTCHTYNTNRVKSVSGGLWCLSVVQYVYMWCSVSCSCRCYINSILGAIIIRTTCIGRCIIFTLQDNQTWLSHEKRVRVLVPGFYKRNLWRKWITFQK